MYYKFTSLAEKSLPDLMVYLGRKLMCYATYRMRIVLYERTMQRDSFMMNLLYHYFPINNINPKF